MKWSNSQDIEEWKNPYCLEYQGMKRSLMPKIEWKELSLIVGIFEEYEKIHSVFKILIDGKLPTA